MSIKLDGIKYANGILKNIDLHLDSIAIAPLVYPLIKNNLISIKESQNPDQSTAAFNFSGALGIAEE